MHSMGLGQNPIQKESQKLKILEMALRAIIPEMALGAKIRVDIIAYSVENWKIITLARIPVKKGQKK